MVRWKITLLSCRLNIILTLTPTIFWCCSNHVSTLLCCCNHVMVWGQGLGLELRLKVRIMSILKLSHVIFINHVVLVLSRTLSSSMLTWRAVSGYAIFFCSVLPLQAVSFAVLCCTKGSYDPHWSEAGNNNSLGLEAGCLVEFYERRNEWFCRNDPEISHIRISRGEEIIIYARYLYKLLSCTSRLKCGQ